MYLQGHMFLKGHICLKGHMCLKQHICLFFKNINYVISINMFSKNNNKRL